MKKKQIPIVPFVFAALLPLALMGVGLFLCYQPVFSIAKVQSKLSYNENWEVEPLPQGQHEHLIKHVFSQPYYYFDSDHHCYAFISRDLQFIFKVFKKKSAIPEEQLPSFPFSLFKHWDRYVHSDNPFVCERVFANYKDAYDNLRSETALVYLHFNKNREFRTKIHLIDSRGKSHYPDLDSVEFVLDRRADQLFSYLTQLSESKDMEKLRRALRSVLKLVAFCCEKGFTTHNHLLKRYFGFVDGKAVQFDCSNLTRDSSMKYPLNFRGEILSAARQLNSWAIEYEPELSFFIQQEAHSIIRSFF